MQDFSLSRKAVDSRPQSILGACQWRFAMGAVRFGLEGTAPSWSRTYGLVLRAATRTQGIMARKELPEERAQVKELQRQLEHARAKLADAGNA